MELSFAIVGCGRIAKRHAAEIMKVGTLLAVCDTDAENAAELATEYGVRMYLSLEEMLLKETELDVVSICTPNGLHAAQSIKCLKANKHVICEKPMCIHSNDARAMIEASIEANRRLFIVKSARYNPLVIALKNLIDEDRLGNIYSFHLNCSWNRSPNYYLNSWKGSESLDGGTLYTQFSHYIDILFWLVGDHSNITGFRKNLHHLSSIEFEDTGAICLEMHSGAVGTIHYSVNSFDLNHEISLNIIAEKGTIHLGGEYMNKIIYQQPALLDTEITQHVNGPNDYGFYRGSTSNHQQVYENIIKALGGEEHVVTDGVDALKTVVFIEEFYNKIKIS